MNQEIKTLKELWLCIKQEITMATKAVKEELYYRWISIMTNFKSFNFLRHLMNIRTQATVSHILAYFAYKIGHRVVRTNYVDRLKEQLRVCEITSDRSIRRNYELGQEKQELERSGNRLKLRVEKLKRKIKLISQLKRS